MGINSTNLSPLPTSKSERLIISPSSNLKLGFIAILEGSTILLLPVPVILFKLFLTFVHGKGGLAAGVADERFKLSTSFF